MKLYNRLNSLLRRRKPRTEQSAVETRIEEGRASGDISPYGQYGTVAEDDVGVPEGLVGEWRAPV